MKNRTYYLLRLLFRVGCLSGQSTFLNDYKDGSKNAVVPKLKNAQYKWLHAGYFFHEKVFNDNDYLLTYLFYVNAKW